MTAIVIFGISNLLLAILSVSKIKESPKKLNFIWYWGFLSGAFVWEDMLIFGILHSLVSFFIVFAQNSEIWIIYYLIFWVVRSSGETLYFFLQQFIQPKHHPHKITTHFDQLKKLFGNISDQKCFIIMQVVMQSITVLSLVGLMLILMPF